MKVGFHLEEKMENLIKIGEYHGISENSTKEVAEILKSQGFLIAYDVDNVCWLTIMKMVKTQ